MKSQSLELEGTWEEIAQHADELAGRRVRLIILSDNTESPSKKGEVSTANALLKHAGTWVGDDLHELLRDVYASRGRTKF